MQNRTSTNNIYTKRENGVYLMDQREKGREKIKELIKNYEDNFPDYFTATDTYNEAQVRVDFLNPFLEALGWDVLNAKQSPQYLREVISEDTVIIEENGKRKNLIMPFALDKKENFSWRQKSLL